MKEEILKIAKRLESNNITLDEAQRQLMSLFNISNCFILVSEQEPPQNIELLAKSPTGIIHLCNWRPAYNIFTCQAKGESSWDWAWKLV